MFSNITYNTNSICFVYIRNLIYFLVITNNMKVRFISVGKVLNTLKNNEIKIKLSKCEFFKAEVSFLGHIIGRIGIRKSPEFIQKIKDYPKTKTVTELNNS